MDKAVNNLLDKSPLHIYVALSVQASVAYKTKISHENSENKYSNTGIDSKFALKS